MAHIEPCPFCGHVGLDFSDGSTYRWGLVSCGGCGTSMEVRRSYPDDFKWHKEGVELWNTRTPTRELVAMKIEDEYVRNYLWERGLIAVDEDPKLREEKQ